jgi:hypothetical protein
MEGLTDMSTKTYAPRPLSQIPGHRDNAKSGTRWCPQDGRDYEPRTLDGKPWCRKCGASAGDLPLEGSFFATSWGYDQTNVEFYRVMGRTKSGKSILLQRWTAKAAPGVDGGPSAAYLVPGDRPAQDPVHGEGWVDEDGWAHRGDVVGYEDMPVFVHRARYRADTGSTTILGHYAHLFDGRPCYATASGWGH